MKKYQFIQAVKLVMLFLFLVCYSWLAYSQVSEQLVNPNDNLNNSHIDTDKVKKGKNAVYFEFGGAALLYSINYEHSFLNNGFTPFVRVGASVAKSIVFPLEAGFHSTKKNGFEVGVGLTAAIGYDEVLGFAKVGYRRESENGFLLKITPMFVVAGIVAVPWIGLSLGKSF